MSITEYNHEKTMQMIREECFEDGVIQGFNNGRSHWETGILIKILSANVQVPIELENRLRKENDEDKINRCVDAITQMPKEKLINAIEEILNE